MLKCNDILLFVFPFGNLRNGKKHGPWGVLP